MFTITDVDQSEARERFGYMHRKALRQDLVARIAGKSNDLLPFDALMEVLRSHEQVLHREPEMIPLDRIVGSVGRYKDFTRDFLPRNRAMMERWARVDSYMSDMAGLAPIDVFKVGSVYFVADGNHRVSVARANGFDAIEAHVTEYVIDVDLQPGDTLDEAIMKAGRARFLADTRLDHHFPYLDLYFTRPGSYTQLLRHLEAYRKLLQRARRQESEVSLEDAAVEWYTRTYLPIVTAIRERQLIKRFPGRTSADLYIWVWAAITEMYELFGEHISPDEGASLLELRVEVNLKRAVEDLMQRLIDSAKDDNADADDIPDWVTQSFEWGNALPLQLAPGGTGE